MSVGNAKVGIFDPETGEEAVIEGGALRVTGVGGATEATLSMLDRYPFLYATEYGATYNYIMKYKGANWLIQRETIATGVRNYAQGSTTIATAFTNRASQTYGLAV